MKRRKEGKTDYKARISLLKSSFPRVVFRKTNRYIIGQLIESKEAKDKIITGVTSKHLINYGWPKEKVGSLKSKPAAYLTGFLLGKKLSDLNREEVILDIGLNRSIAKSKIYYFVKGLVDAGINLKVSEKMLPKEEELDIPKEIKQQIEKKFV